MAEKMNGDVQLAAARKVAWNALKRCIPGREELNMDFATDFQAVAERGNRLILLAD